MTRVVDLDALRHQRAEGRGEPPVLVFKGERFELPVEMPVEVVEAWNADADAVTFAQAVFGDEWERFKALHPSREDILYGIGGHLLELWGVNHPESTPSGDSSSNDGTTSRATSSSTITSTSDELSGDQMPSAPAG